MFCNEDVNLVINKYLDKRSVFLLRESFKNKFRILEYFEAYKNIYCIGLNVLKNKNIENNIYNDEYNLQLILDDDKLCLNKISYSYLNLKFNSFNNIVKTKIRKLKINPLLKNIKTDRTIYNILIYEILKNNTLKNVKNIECDLSIILSFIRYLLKRDNNNLKELDKLIINMSYSKENTIMIDGMFIIELLKNINIKHLIFKECNKLFKYNMDILYSKKIELFSNLKISYI
tara:strand:+ start:63 stop:755 length:693 start_codon:yes stop_codon:yes gene_type:complete